MRHVSAEAVSRVMQLFRRMFLVDQDSDLPDIWTGNSAPQRPTIKQRALAFGRTMRRRIRSAVAGRTKGA